MIIPTSTTYSIRNAAEADEFRRRDIRGMVNAVFDYMIECGTPYDPQNMEQGDYGPSLECYRESLTLFITAWHHLAFAFDDGSHAAKPEIDGAPDRKLAWWKVWALQASKGMAVSACTRRGADEPGSATQQGSDKARTPRNRPVGGRHHAWG
jgi:hypothetical protein